MKNKAYIGIDLGGTKILTAVADQNGKIINDVTIPTEVEKGSEAVFKNIHKSLKEVLSGTDLHRDNIEAIGIGSPGPLDVEQGLILKTANLPFVRFPLVERIKEKMGIPVYLQNDANTAALGEKFFGAGKNVNNMIYVTVSTGVGGGIIIDGEIYYGSSGNAGEVGHMVVDPAGPVCGCGNHGCLESFSSGTAIARMGRKAVKENSSELLNQLAGGDLDQIDAEIVAKAARKEDRVAIEIYNTVGRYLGLGLANLTNIFNPKLIVLGGGVMNAKELFKDEMERSLVKSALADPRKTMKITQAKLGAEIGVKGAIAVALNKVEG
jgi:glucokinase